MLAGQPGMLLYTLGALWPPGLNESTNRRCDGKQQVASVCFNLCRTSSVNSKLHMKAHWCAAVATCCALCCALLDWSTWTGRSCTFGWRLRHISVDKTAKSLQRKKYYKDTGCERSLSWSGFFITIYSRWTLTCASVSPGFGNQLKTRDCGVARCVGWFLIAWIFRD